MAKLNWIKARSDCSVDAVFAALKSAVQDDFKQHKALNPERAANLEYEQRDRKCHIRDASTGRIIMFGLEGERIKAVRILPSGQEGYIVSGTPAINMEGQFFECEGGRTLHPWQFRMIALEDIFFGREILEQKA